MSLFKSKLKKVTSIILSSLFVFTIFNPAIPVYAAGETDILFTEHPFVAFSTGRNPLLFNVENSNVEGSIYSNADINSNYSKNITVTESVFSSNKISGDISCSNKKEHVSKSKMPDILYFIDQLAEYNHVISEDTNISYREIDLSENSLKIDGQLTLENPQFIGSGYITVSDSIIYEAVSKVQDNSCAVITSINGDITISGSDVTINGVLFAPNGRIQINAKNVTINGAVYGKDIEFNTTNLNLNYSEEIVSKVVPTLIADAGEDREIFVDENVTLEGSVNFEDAATEWSLLSGPEGSTIESPNTLPTTVSFTTAGEYVFKLTCKMDAITGEDTVCVNVKPAPCKTFTSTSDFNLGENKDVDNTNNELKLASPSEIPKESFSKEYTTNNPSGVKVNNSISKSAVESFNDSLSIGYELSGYGSIEVSKGIDFIFLIDNSGSMSGSYLTNAQEAAKEIIGFMGENDRYSVCSLQYKRTDFTNDAALLISAINNIKSYDGSSSFGSGLKMALDIFDGGSEKDRQKYIILLTDGENGGYTDDNLAMAQAERALTNGVKIYSLAMKSQRINMQNVAMISKGIYKYCPDAETIKQFMLMLAENIFNGAGRKLSLRTTVTKSSFIDFQSISPAPSEVKKNEDGSSTLIWNLGDIEIDQLENISLGLHTSLLTGKGYETITTDTMLSYYDKDGNGRILYLDDIILPKNDVKPTGTWSAVYDSQRENCVWTSVFYNALYNGNSNIDVYVSTSNDGTEFSEKTKITNYESLENTTGRYIKVEAEFTISEDGSTPVLYDITVTSEEEVSDTSAKNSTVEIKGKNTTAVNKPLILFANTKTALPLSSVEWSVNDNSNVIISGENSLMKTFIFTSSGQYTVTAKATIGDVFSESSYTITVSEAEKMENIGDGSETVNYNLKMEVSELPEAVKYNSTHELSIQFSDSSQLAWARVIYNRGNTDFAPNITDDYKCSIRFDADPNNTHFVTVQAFDWAGNMLEKKMKVFLDSTYPTGSLNVEKSSIYCGDTAVITTGASDNYGIASKVLSVNNEEVELNEDGTYEFKTEIPGTYTFRLDVVDKAGNSSYIQKSIQVTKDTYAPSLSISATKTTVYLGLDSLITVNASDSQTGIKSLKVALNGDSITLDENNQYLFKPTLAGTYVFECTATDNRDNTTVRTCTITVINDTVNPNVSIAVSNGKVNVGSSITVTVTATDNVKVAHLKFFVNGTEYKLDENNQYVFHALDEHIGTVTFSATATDDVENTRTTTRNITVQEKDITSPTVSLSANSKINLKSTAYMTVTATDDIEVAKIEVAVNGTIVQLDSNSRYYFDTSDFFTYDVSVKATDTSGNETIRTAMITVVDTTAPNISITSNKSIYTAGETITYTVKITDNGKIASVYVTLNGEVIDAEGATDFTITVENAAAGSCSLFVKATDESGNTKESTRAVTVKDTTAPTIVLVSDKDKYTIGETPVIQLDADDNVGVTKITATLNDASIEYINGKLILPTVWEIGIYKLVVIASDAAGNSSTKQIQFEIEPPKDNISPVIKNITVTPGIIEVGTTMEIAMEATDDSGSVTVAVTADGTELARNNAGRFTYVPTKSGECIVVITASDPSGNTTTARFSVFVYESISGHKLKVEAPSVVSVGELVTVKISAADNKDFDTVEFSVDGTKIAHTSPGVYQFTASQAKKYNCIATGRDNTGFIDTYEFQIAASELFENTVQSGIYDEYLKFNDEIRLTSDMKKLADKLKTPTAVYEYLSNNIKYESYINSRKGAIGAFEQYGGNDVDQSSLFIAMLRYLGYPARYVNGKITLSESQLKSLFGTDNFQAAAQIIADSRRTSTIVTNGSERSISMNHTWVEVYIPYSEISADAEKAKYGLWTELDTSIKASVNTEYSSENVVSAKEKAVINQLISGLDSIKSDKDFSSIYDSAGAIYGNTEDANKGYVVSITQQKFNLLPPALQYKVESRTDPYAAVTTANSDTIGFKTNDKYYNTDNLSTVKTAAVYGKRVTVSFVPASPSDEELLNKNGGDLTKIPAQSINLVPALKVDGKIIAKGSNAVQLGSELSLNITIKTGGTSTTETDIISAGSMYAIALNLMRISGDEISDSFYKAYNNAVEDQNVDPFSDEILGAFLDTVGKAYFSQCDMMNTMIGAYYNVNAARNTSVAVLGYEFEATENIIGTVTGLKPGKFFIDVDYNTHYVTALNGDKEKRKQYLFASGMMESYFESAVWEQTTGIKSVSTIEIFSQAMKSDIDMYLVTSENCADVIDTINIDSSSKSEIRNAVSAGYTVMVPSKEITINDWTGTGYAILDLDNFSSSTYRISGGLSGGATTVSIDLLERMDTETLDNVVWSCYRICYLIAQLQLGMAIMDLSAFASLCSTSYVGAVIGSVQIYNCVTSVVDAINLQMNAMCYTIDYILGDKMAAVELINLAFDAAHGLMLSGIGGLIAEGVGDDLGTACEFLFSSFTELIGSIKDSF